MTDATANQPRAPLNLRGTRFKPLTWETLTPTQLSMVDSVMSGKRGSMQGPYNVLLRSPELGNLAQQFGAHTRFNSSLPLRLNELAILMVARFWRCEFVWWAHRQIAIDNGLPAALVELVLGGQAPVDLPSDLAAAEAAVFAFCHELIETRRVGDPAYAALVTQFGEAGVVDLMGTMSYYTLVSMSLNVDQYPLPPGASPSFGHTRSDSASQRHG